MTSTTGRRPRKLAPLQAAIDQCLTEDAQRSDRDIARTLKCHWSTVNAHRTRLENDGSVSRADRRPPSGHVHPGHNVEAAPVGNVRAMRSGVRSERRIGPIIDRELPKLQARWPGESEWSLRQAARRVALVELLTERLDHAGLNAKGQAMRPEVTALVSAEASLERQLLRFEANAKQRSNTGGGLAAVLAEITGNGEAA